MTAPRSLTVTPDGRYLVVRGRLWRMANPYLGENERAAWVQQLMVARRTLRTATDVEQRAEIRRRVDEAKRALGERGPVWWEDGAPDENRKLAKNSSYADWFASIDSKL